MTIIRANWSSFSDVKILDMGRRGRYINNLKQFKVQDIVIWKNRPLFCAEIHYLKKGPKIQVWLDPPMIWAMPRENLCFLLMSSPTFSGSDAAKNKRLQDGCKWWKHSNLYKHRDRNTLLQHKHMWWVSCLINQFRIPYFLYCIRTNISLCHNFTWFLSFADYGQCIASWSWFSASIDVDNCKNGASPYPVYYSFHGYCCWCCIGSRCAGTTETVSSWLPHQQILKSTAGKSVNRQDQEKQM